MNRVVRMTCGLLAMVGGVGVLTGAAEISWPNDRVSEFRERYVDLMTSDNHLMSKIVSDRGNGYEPLYGLRNMRTVLHGVMYRGGANNVYHRDNPRDNRNPLPPDGLVNLCREGFGTAIYLYATNFQPYSGSCEMPDGGMNSLEYQQISVLQNDSGVQKILQRVYECATELGPCPIYAHCWNGWHASGYISAVALRQFCGFDGEAAVQYWIDGTDSPQNHNYPAIKDAIRAFVPNPEWIISESLQAEICPQSPYSPY